MRDPTMWRTLLGVEKTVVEDVDLDFDVGTLVAQVRPTSPMRNCCGSCQKRSPRYDRGVVRRRWRGLDAGTTRVDLEADSTQSSQLTDH
ncbi:hypothetical protein FB472_2757 [Rhodoglobus vestalii]|uniref:Transposase IS204/IS1001/IS1096/IS1165 zinc-finger domain-containing protein n=1 Tax=Rhodoglobus vestalii TaxID=193384 RepID=A0A8H2K768_9MICO|nr:hypothetical protein FB472_2757 [Rhodoglobus vestalii]